MFDAEVWQAVFLGVVQGVTEFLPISSDGHLTVLNHLLRNTSTPPAAEAEPLELILALHVGTLFSILLVYSRDLLRVLTQPRLCWLVVVATIPAGTIGLLFKDFFEETFESPLVAGFGFLVTSVLLFLGHRFEQNRKSVEELGTGESFLIGVCQAAALFPGISRSGSTIAAGLGFGLRREAAALFSFLIAVPAISGASLLLARDLLSGQGGTHNPLALLAGAVTSFVVGFFALRWLIRLVTQRKLHWFAWYCLALGTTTIVWQLASSW